MNRATTAARLCGALAAAALAASCGTPAPPRADDAAVRAFVARGYDAVAQAAVTTSTQRWPVAGQLRTVVLSRPAQQQSPLLPLVLYLPGLGEASLGGEHWRLAWAAAGYAVLAVQPLADDTAAWASDLARAGDFKALGRQRFGAAALAERTQALAAVLQEAQRRAAAGEADWQRIDWHNMAVAGFDLGAYTAMALAGERGADAPAVLDAQALRLPVRATLALSPFADVAAGALGTRYGGIRGPVLSITGNADADALGLSDGRLRTLPYERMPAPDKYLLSLNGVLHANLSGTAGTPAAPDHAAANRGRAAGQAGDSGGGQRGGSRGGRHPQGQGQSAAARQDGDSRNADPSTVSLAPTALQMRLTAAQGVSTAFLDAYLKNDPLARQWLADSAARWLAGAGDLQRK